MIFINLKQKKKNKYNYNLIIFHKKPKKKYLKTKKGKIIK